MADNTPASTPAAVAPTNTPATPSPGAAPSAADAAGAAAPAIEAVIPAQPHATGVVSKRSVIGRPAPLPAREAAPVVAPKDESAQAAPSASASKEASSAPSTEKPSDKPKEPGSRAEDPKLGRAWADVMDREATLVEKQKALTEEQRKLTAEKAASAAEKAEAAAILADLKTPGKKLAALKRAGVELTELQKEYLEQVDDPVEAARNEARETVRKLEEEKLAETKRLAQAEVDKHTAKATEEINATYKALETEFVANAAEYSAITSFDLSKEQVIQFARSELGRLPTPTEGKVGMAAAQKFFHDRIVKAGYVSKSEVDALVAAAVAKATAAPAINPAPDISPGTITSRGSVPVVRRPPTAASTWQERLEEGKRLLGIKD